MGTRGCAFASSLISRAIASLPVTACLLIHLIIGTHELTVPRLDRQPLLKPGSNQKPFFHNIPDE